MSVNIGKVIFVWISSPRTYALLAGMTILFIIGFLLLGKNLEPAASGKQKLKVTTSFYPLTYLVERIGGEYVEVTTLTPAGAEPHDFEPNTRDIVELQKSDILFLNGGGLEGYGEKLKVERETSKAQVFIVGEGLMSIKNDPHVWLDPVLYKKEAEIITAALIKRDPKHARELKAQSEKLKAELEILDDEFTRELQNCKQRNIVTAHSAFSYLAKRYGFRQLSIAGLSPEMEPSAKTLIELVEFVKNNKVKHIFFEEFVSPVIAQTLAREVGAQTLVLNPLEGLTKKDMMRGRTYISIQRENLKNLKIALECKEL